MKFLARKQSVQRMLLDLLLIYMFTLNLVLSHRFSIIQPLHRHRQKSDTANSYPKQQQLIVPLKSYKPHFIQSYSYPQPITAHWFYGEVVGSRPKFWLKEVINTTQETQKILTVNNEKDDGFYEKADSLKTQHQSDFKYMLSLQVESALKNQAFTHSISVKHNEHFYAIYCQYADKKKQYLLYFSYQDYRVLSRSQVKDLGVKYGFRDEAALDHAQAWRFPLQLRFNGSIENEGEGRYGGFVMQIQYISIELAKSVKVHIKEIYQKPSHQEKAQQILQRLLQIPVDKTFLEPSEGANSLNKLTCATDAIRKLKAGLSYEYGTLQIVNGSQIINNEPLPLLSFSPSRTRFPWGFLWDDGFHCEVIVRSEPQLALKVVKSWLETMMDNGWIPRQQNRGEEREYLCSCPNFMRKDIRDGNPPSLMLSLDYLARKNMLNRTNFQEKYWNKLEKYYSWFNSTQKSEIDDFVYRWYDSIPNNGSFNSGLDDFPRLLNTSGHVDIQAWMYFFSQVMERIYPIYSSESKNPYSYMKEQIKLKMKTRFIDPDSWVCADFANTTFSKFLGYPSLLPLAFGMMQKNSLAYNGTLRLLKQRMDIGFGISSIAKDSPFYLQNQNAYWRGPVWININYLVLKGLHRFYPQEKELYEKLRKNILDTVCGNWNRTGYFFENYKQGVGSSSFPFNGWTSLIAIIDSEQY